MTTEKLTIIGPGRGKVGESWVTGRSGSQAGKQSSDVELCSGRSHEKRGNAEQTNHFQDVVDGPNKKGW